MAWPRYDQTLVCDGAELHNLAKAFSPLFLVSKRCPPKSRPSPCSAQVDDNGPDSSVRYNIYIYIVARCRTAWRVKPARERERVTERERAVRWWNRMAKIWWKMMHPIVWVLFLGQVPPASDSSVHKAVTGLSPGRRESLAPRTGFC